MKYFLTFLVVLLSHISFSNTNDSLTVIVVSEYRYNRKVYLFFQDDTVGKMLDFKEKQLYELRYAIDSINNQSSSIEFWEKRIPFGFRKITVDLNNYRAGEILILDRSRMMKRRYAYNWYWVKSRDEIRTYIMNCGTRGFRFF